MAESRSRSPEAGSQRRGSDAFEGAYSFKRLLMWEKAQMLAAEVLALTRRLPSDRASAVLAQQVLRSASSIGANIAEGHGRYSPAAYRNHLSIARGSTAETISWIDLLGRDGMISKAEEDALLERLAELMRLITSKMIDLNRRSESTALQEERETYVFE